MIYTQEIVHAVVEKQRQFFRTGVTLDVNWRIEQLKKLKQAVMDHRDMLEKALYEASIVPLEIMRKIYEMILIHEEYSKKGSRLAISDVAVGVLFCKSALLGASMNVFINTKSMKDREVADKLNAEADKLIADGSKLADSIYAGIAVTLR